MKSEAKSIDKKVEAEELLKKYKIPIDQWGKGEAKTIDNLLKEIENGETILIEDESGELMRKVSTVWVHVFFQDANGNRYRLIEEKEVFDDGRERIRNLGTSVGEKMKPGEGPVEAAKRALEEELGLKGIAPVFVEEEKQEMMSPSYPGLKSKYTKYHFNFEMSPDQYNPEGYVEKEGGKTTYFKWIPDKNT